MSDIVVIADDLTGALDTGVQFLDASRSVVIVDSRNVHKQLNERSNVIVVNTESRHLSSEKAFEVVRFVAEVIRRRSDSPLVFKKIDSTFRGNIASEVTALATVFPDRSMLVAPAFPSQGRTTRNGFCLVDGVPLDRTDFALDPLNPIRNGYIPAILYNDVLRPVVVPIERLRRWAARASWRKEAGLVTPERLERNRETAELAVVDASTDADLARIASVWRHYSASIIPVGSAGLAAHVFERPASAEPLPILDGPLILINGSLNPTALRQTRHAIESGFVDVVLTDVFSFSDVASCVAEHLETGRNVCVRTVLQSAEVGDLRESLLGTLSKQLHSDATPLHELLPKAFGEIIKQTLEQAMPGGILVFGGDTALGIMSTLQASALQPIAEPLPGVVVSNVCAPEATPPLITKAGGFGDHDLAVQLLNRMRRVGE